MQAAIGFRSADHARWGHQAVVLPAAPADFDDADLHGHLRVRVLRTALERQAIARLRRHAAFDTENDLGLGLQPFESTRDEIGHVVAVYRGERVIASARAVPTGHGLTAAERMLEKFPFDGSVLGAGSWEIGRMVMEQEDRSPALLQECLALCLEEFLQAEHVRHLHATTSGPVLARLWRRVGMRTLTVGVGASGKRYALVHAPVEDLMTALRLPHYVQEPQELSGSVRPRAALLA